MENKYVIRKKETIIIKKGDKFCDYVIEISSVLTLHVSFIFSAFFFVSAIMWYFKATLTLSGDKA